MRRKRFVQDPILSRDLFWLTVTMGFLASLFVVSAIEISDRLTAWRLGFSGYATIQVLPLDELSSQSINGLEGEATDLKVRVDEIVNYFTESPLISEVSVLSESDVRTLLSPWIGEAAELKTLPVPIIIDLKFEAQNSNKVQAMFEKLLETVDGLRLDTHSEWLKNASLLAWTIQVVAAIVGCVVLSVVVLTVTHFVRSSMAERQRVIELLHTLGATNLDISSSYMGSIVSSSLIGACMGHALASGLFILILSLLPDMGVVETVQPIGGWHSLLSPLLASPMIAVIVVLVSLSSRQTILSSLGSLPYNGSSHRPASS